MSTAFDLWRASLPHDPTGLHHPDPAVVGALCLAFNAGMRVAAARDRRLEQLVTLAAGFAAGLGQHIKKSSDVYEWAGGAAGAAIDCLAELERRDKPDG